MDCKIGILKTRSVKNLVGAGWYRMVIRYLIHKKKAG